MKKLLLTAFLIGTFSMSYAQSNYYNDYQRSITDINWQSVVADLLLSTTQANQINNLNSRYRDYNTWNKVYVVEPGRWRNDRYSELERILGREKYAQFKKRYYRGQNPVIVYNVSKNDYKKYRKQQDKYYKNQEKYYKKQNKHRGHGHDGDWD
ncbi:hypothetical protein C1637_05145 [Chryseobacterium lactis]|uniref:DUF3106 domain-containing protein n=1 Tax=Chryseobacterium lactis TaxID=1241981 RepID=A0A3G6RI43_CHRLC|nr:hypothetical protein [Chryseobacterium lactis]AZA84233.1 hypothetical protein EG342_21115 [Chryseobacterium lactis]AZB04621.1 hypothetical protein EG341_11995 [Chryseobacterium lactis]PNW14352.1 hypothetical protein C1637_05145 [Chryseobacterium lactis]